VLTKMNIKLISTAIASVIMISGCTSIFEVGEEPTVCPISLDPGIPCTSTRDALELTSTPDGISREKARRKAAHDREEHGDDHEEKVKATTKANVKTKVQTPYDYQKMSEAYQYRQDLNRMLPAPEPIAVRQQPRMLRVAFSPWEDNFGRLQNIGYVYSEVEERKYKYGREAFNMPAQITPLSIRQVSLEDERRMNEQGQNGLGIRTNSVNSSQAASMAAGGTVDQAPAQVVETFRQVQQNK
jgi:conjugal transfer pilus assembly protein TraV